MKLPTLETCCCGCSLTCGAVTWAILGILGALSSLGFDSLPILITAQTHEIGAIKAVVLLMASAQTLLNLVTLCLSVSLIIGARQERKELVFPWVMIAAIEIPISLISNLTRLIIFCQTPNKRIVILVVALIAIFAYLIYLGITMYSLIVVYSLYEQLEADDNSGQPPSMYPQISSRPMQPPYQGGPMQPPYQGGPRQPPYQGGPMQPPYQGGPRQPPYQGGPMQPPYQGGPMQPPYQGGPMQPPNQGGPMLPPNQGGPMQPPNQSGPMQPPNQGGPMQPPYQGGPMQPPYQGGPMQPPYQGGPMQPPYQGGPMQPPNQGGPKQK